MPLMIGFNRPFTPVSGRRATGWPTAGRRPARPADHQPRSRGPAAGLRRRQWRHLPGHGHPDSTWRTTSCRARWPRCSPAARCTSTPRIGAAGDVDAAVAVLTHEDGTLTTIDDGRRGGVRLRPAGRGIWQRRPGDIRRIPPRHAGWHVGREARARVSRCRGSSWTATSSPTARSGRRSTPISPEAGRRRSELPTRGTAPRSLSLPGSGCRWTSATCQVKEIG